jgi:hypothetical protein
MFLLILVLACGVETPSTTNAPASAKPEEPQPAVTHWQLVGRVTPGASPYPDAPPFEGGKMLVSRCRDRRPCAAERWKSEGGEFMNLLRLADKIHFPDGRKPWPAQWMSISGTLRRCLGGPLSIPPTDDPESVRTLQIGPDGGHWILHFSGQNSCGLKGTMKLDTGKDHIDLRSLTCEGKRWNDGGRQCVRDRLEAMPR